MAGSTLAGPTMIPISIFTFFCFAYPILSTTISIAKDYGYMQGRASTMPVRKQDEWKQKDGKVIKISTMDDSHLANSLRMIARQWAEGNYSTKVTGNIWFKALALEATKRNFRITHLKTPIKVSGRME